MYWPHFLGLFTLHNGTCINESVECGWTPPTWNGVIIVSRTPWNGISSWKYAGTTSSVHGCQWTCNEDAWYVVNSDKTWCIKSLWCWDYNEYGSMPWLNKNKLCSAWWSLDSSYRPRIGFSLNNVFCDPTFTWRCKKDWTNTIKDCEEKSINTLYVGVGINNQYYWDTEEIYLDWLYGRDHMKRANADGITAKMGYYHKITDGPETCAINPSDELFYDGLTSTPVRTYQFNYGYNDGTAGFKIHNFQYTPAIYTLNGTQYVLSTLRSTNIGYFNDYSCTTRSRKLHIFGCPGSIYF